MKIATENSCLLPKPPLPEVPIRIQCRTSNLQKFRKIVIKSHRMIKRNAVFNKQGQLLVIFDYSVSKLDKMHGRFVTVAIRKMLEAKCSERSSERPTARAQSSHQNGGIRFVFVAFFS